MQAASKRYERNMTWMREALDPSLVKLSPFPLLYLLILSNCDPSSAPFYRTHVSSSSSLLHPHPSTSLPSPPHPQDPSGRPGLMTWPCRRRSTPRS